jgi:phenylpropionate dioxygenase-like ring-hydroxylating dioxygenase large terminal subunit
VAAREALSARASSSRLTAPIQPRKLPAAMSLSDYWYVACESAALDARPLGLSLLGQPLVLFRGDGHRPVALLDRCPHRNVPLSLGSVRAATLECRYHGWRFDAQGSCVHVPHRCGVAAPASAREQSNKARATRFATREQDGLVWCWGRPDAEPSHAPYQLAPADARDTCLQRSFDYPAGLHASLENTIDVPHTAYLHRGLFRARTAQQRVRCTLTRTRSEVLARYEGESRPDTWLARVLAPGGGTLEHEDRFILPSIVRVEYRLGSAARLLSTAFFTPLDATHTRLYVRIAYRLGRLPGAWLAPLLERVSTRVLREDAEILAQQARNLVRFGGAQFASTELDHFSTQIQELLTLAERGTLCDETRAKRFELML